MRRLFVVFVLLGCGSSKGETPQPDAAPLVDRSTCMKDAWAVKDELRACTADADCVVRLHQDDCCGSFRYIGIASSQTAVFDPCEPSHRATAIACECATNPDRAEDGKLAPALDGVGVRCASRKCTTYVK